VLSFEILKKRFLLSRSKFEKEHVTTNIIKNKKYKKYSLELNKNYSNLRITIDTKNDLQILEKLLKRFNYNLNIKFQEIIEFYSKNKNFFRENSNFIRNSEMSLNTGQKLWIRAKNIIPGGTMLFSKNPDLQLPKKWPAYYSKAKKCYIWDCDGKKFTDIGLMGVGTNILGYSNKDVDKQVKRAVDNSNLSSLNCVEQIILAEKLIEIHPWSDMARFTRSGGEANAVAIRIARSYSGKDNVAFCGYHGWHDWYLSANLSNKNNLDKHLLKHLSVDGVPKKLKSTSFAFDYNDFQGLKRLVDEKNIGIIKMEVERNEKPKDNFLQKVRDLANKKNIILIFDECTSGFRSNFGGLHLNYRVYPDLAILGKALGNGYAINAIIGKKDIMKAVENTFISSTFWTEKIGYVAALETLKIMEKIKSWRTISSIGKKIRFNWQRLSRKYSLNLHIQGIDALPNFYFKLNKNNYYKTFICQEMLKRNILSSNSVYACIYHNDKILQSYFETLDEIFSKIKKCEDDKYNINNLLETDPSISGIRDYKKFI
jgi:glutamate-1-semialdehyde aminotransferase